MNPPTLSRAALKPSLREQQSWRGTALHFSTPLFCDVWEDYDAQAPTLLAAIDDYIARGNPESTTNVGGYRSDERFLRSAGADDRLRPLVSYLEASASRYVADWAGAHPEPRHAVHVDGWINVAEAGSYKKIHMHHDCDIAGAFYPDVGAGDVDELSDDGLVEFLDPRGAAPTRFHPAFNFMPPRMKVRPRRGMLLLFPNWLGHFVNPFHGAGRRISIGLDITLRDAAKS